MVRKGAHVASRAVTIEAWLVMMALGVTIWLFQSGLFERIITASNDLGPIPASLLTGAAFATFVTTPIAIGSFITMGGMHTIPIWQIAALGAVGATIVDLLLVRGARSPLALFIVRTVTGGDAGKFKARFRRVPALRWVAAAIGGFLVAIPLPTDELGVVLFSASGLRALQMIPVIFVADFVGVYAVVSAAQLFG